jgi:hypothetical protein
VEILHRLTPATRQWPTHSVRLLTTCLIHMQLLQPNTPVSAASTGSSFSTGSNISHPASPLKSQSANNLPTAWM